MPAQAENRPATGKCGSRLSGARHVLQLVVARCDERALSFVAAGFPSAPGRIRTSGPLVRSQMLYPAELRVQGRDSSPSFRSLVLSSLVRTAAEQAERHGRPRRCSGHMTKLSSRRVRPQSMGSGRVGAGPLASSCPYADVRSQKAPPLHTEKPGSGTQSCCARALSPA